MLGIFKRRYATKAEEEVAKRNQTAQAPTFSIPTLNSVDANHGVSSDDARKMILNGSAPDGLIVNGTLNFAGETKLRVLPRNLSCSSLDVSDCANLTALPEGLTCYGLTARNLNFRTLPEGLRVKFRLDLSGCTLLEKLPDNLNIGSILLRDCMNLAALPEGMDVSFLDISGCTRLERFPQQARISIGQLIARGCTRLRELPAWLEPLAEVDLAGCELINALPANFRVSSWLDLAGTEINSVSERIQLRWRGVPIERRIAFQPETITGQEVLNTENVELRRVLLERMGFERFLEEVDAQILDQDRDPGGERRLMRVPFPGDEAFVAIWVICPSTDRNYVLRVPPTMTCCHQAAAWLAGFDDPNDYKPVIEA
jgi:hypothetical protein